MAKPQPAAYQRKAFAFELKSSNEDGTFTGVASVYGNKDLQGDVVDKGAFTKSIQDRGAEVPILWQHDPTTPIGLGTLTDTKSGLQIAGKLSLGTSKGRDAYELLKDGVITGLSIGYDVVRQKFADGARHLQELKLHEVSAVTFPANTDAQVGSVKAAALDTLDLPHAQVAMVRALLRKDASLNDKICAVYDVVNDAFPFGNAWVVDVFDDHAIVNAGERLFSIALTWTDAEGDGELDDPVLGDITEVERVYVPVGGGPKALADAVEEIKAGRVISSGNADKLKAAQDHMTKAAAHVADVIASGKPKKPTVKADDHADLIQSLRAVNDTLRPKTAA